jgi:hypothetical protein
MLAWETRNDNEFVTVAMAQIAQELRERTGLLLLTNDLKFSSFEGLLYDSETSAQSAILQRAATLKESKGRLGYVRLA